MLCFVCGECDDDVKLFKAESLSKCVESLVCRIHFNLKYKNCKVPAEIDADVGYHSRCYSNFNALKAEHRLSTHLSTLANIMVMCWAPDCKHYNVREDCHFFRFPKEPNQRKRWKKLLGRDVEPGAGAFVCSCHFRDGKKENGPELFECNSKERLAFFSPEKKTRKRVVKAPTVLEASGEQQEDQTVQFVVQEQETSGPSFDIKEEITIEESVLEDYFDIPKLENASVAGIETTVASHDTLDKSQNKKQKIGENSSFLNIIPKLEIFENTNHDIIRVNEKINYPNVENINDHKDYAMYIADRLHNANQSDCAIAMAKQKIEQILYDLETGIFENNIQKKIGDEDIRVEEDPLFNIVPKLENLSEDIIRVESENRPLQENILQYTVKDNIHISSSSSNKFHSRKRKLSDQDSRVEEQDLLNTIQVRSENREDYAVYATYIATRFKNTNQSNCAIATAKQKIELILCDLERGIFGNSFH